MTEESDSIKKTDRKGFFRNAWMYTGLITAYGTVGYFILRYLAPSRRKKEPQKVFIAFVDDLSEGRTYPFRTPDGESYLLRLTRTKEGEIRFVAFSSRCPHLGCKVFWEEANGRYFCPCHNGVFNQSGIAIGGPPSKEKKNLKPCKMEVVDKALYALVELV